MPTFSTEYAPPDPPTGLVIVADVPSSSVTVSWTATALGVDFAAYIGWRSRDGGVTWEEVARITVEGVTSFVDYEGPLNVPLQYGVSVMNTTYFESTRAQAGTELQAQTWWLVTPGDPSHTFALAVVSGFDDVTPMQDELFEPLGRNRKVVVMGEQLGSEGTLQVNVSREDAMLVDMVRQAQMHVGEYILLKNTFGEVFRSHIRSIRRRREVAGRQQLTIPYVEVA